MRGDVNVRSSTGQMVTAAILLAALAGGSGACGRGSEPSSATTGRRARDPAVNPARDARHDARRCHRARRGRYHHPVVQRRRRPRPPLPAGIRDGARDAAVACVADDRPLPGGARHPRERAPRGRRRRRFWPSGSRAPDTGPPPSCRASCSRSGSAWAAGSMSTTTGCPRGGRIAPRETSPTRRSPPSTVARIAPLFMWVHYWDPHHPYTPPEPFRSAHPTRPYLGEVAYMDAELGRLVEAFERRAGGPPAIIVVGDHGEGLGDHGESQHGNLLYESTMRVPLVVAGPGVAAGTSDAPVSIRRVFHTVARLGRARGGGQPAGRVDGRGPRRGDEAVSRVRLAAADHGGAGQAEGHLRRHDRTLRRRRRPGRGTRPLRGRRPPRGDARRTRRLPGAVARGGAGPCRARAPRTGRRWPAWAT